MGLSAAVAGVQSFHTRRPTRPDRPLPAGVDERFVRLWRFYLMYCEGGFMGSGIDVAQVTLVKA